MTQDYQKLEKLAKMIRYYILTATTNAVSGHPTSSLSAVELMVGLMFGGTFLYDLERPDHPNNDRLIFSKGHASPLFYALWLAADKVTEKEMMTYREFGSPLEGHPTVRFPYAEAATGSLGQGLSIGVGMALNGKYLDRLGYKTYVLLGDSEMAEGSQWEATELAAYYKLDNLIGILDVNRLGQRGETLYGHDLAAFEKRISSFGWQTYLVDGHSFHEILDAYTKCLEISDRPAMVIAKTIKGKGVSFIEDQNGWHGKPLKKKDLEKALDELGSVDKTVRGVVPEPRDQVSQVQMSRMPDDVAYKKDEMIATRTAYGNALKRIFPKYTNIVSLDGEVSNSTRAEYFKKAYPDNFFEMYVAEQNMVGTALGLARLGKLPFVSSFGAFLTRAFDQIRMSQYSDANIKFVGSHAGVAIGEDGPSQMALEDIAMFRSILSSVVLYPCDAVSAEYLVEAAAEHDGIVYIRTSRGKTPVIYDNSETFVIGGAKVLRQSLEDRATVIGAGVTLHEALAAYDVLQKEGISIRVVDLYSVKPLDEDTLIEAARETRFIVTVEDHYPAGGIGEAVKSALSESPAPVYALCATRIPRSGKPEELLDYEGISANAIADVVREKMK